MSIRSCVAALALVLVTLPFIAPARAQQQTPPCSYAGQESARLRALSLPVPVPDTLDWPRRDYDVLSYKLVLDWRSTFRDKVPSFPATTDITLRLTQPMDSLDLDAGLMTIDTLRIDGVPVVPAPQPGTDEKLWIPLTTKRDSGAVISLHIAYTRHNYQGNGFYFFPKGTYDPNFKDTTTEDLAYTMSEPLDARHWMPCMDLPYDKASSSEISIIVPQLYSAQSNGTLVSVTTNADDSRTYYWKSDKPISTYLMVADASNYIEWGDYYHRVSNPQDSVPVVYFAWPSDYYGNTKYHAQPSLEPTPRMLAAFSKRFGEYPFVKYGQAAVEPFDFGGMEHQTMTTIHRYWFNECNEDGIAHELMHQWFGDKTTCETWADIWLNEGFATYGEAIWEEDAHGHDAYIHKIEADNYGFFYTQWGTNQIAIYDPPIENVFNYQTTYLKGGLVLHMLRRLVNDDTAFFATLRDYSNAFAYTTANSYQFRDFVDARLAGRTPMSVSDFLNEWVFDGGYPIYDFSWSQSSANTLTLRVGQSQTTNDHYTMPLHFIAYSGGQPQDLSFLNTKRLEFFSSDLLYHIDSLKFDSDAVVPSIFTLQEVPNLGVQTSNSAAPSMLVSYENGFTKLSFVPVASQEASLRIVDELSRTIVSSPLERGETMFSWQSNRAASGSYFAVLTDGASTRMLKLHIER